MTYAYPRGLRGPAVHDAMLVAAWFVILFLGDVAVLRFSLLLATPVVLAWGVVTLHFPSRVDVDDEGVAFFHYRRVHRFAWKDVARVRVRKFLVKDRVLVRLEPSAAWRGRYWIVDSIEGFDALVAAFEARATR
jgi:hypothetical protein